MSENELILKTEKTFEEIKHIDIYDYVVENDDLDTTIEKVINIIESEKNKVSRLDINL